MTELPPEMGKNIGVTARTFSKGAGSEDKDRSEWTDTPADKLKKEKVRVNSSLNVLGPLLMLAYECDYQGYMSVLGEHVVTCVC